MLFAAFSLTPSRLGFFACEFRLQLIFTHMRGTPAALKSVSGGYYVLRVYSATGGAGADGARRHVYACFHS